MASKNKKTPLPKNTATNHDVEDDDDDDDVETTTSTNRFQAKFSMLMSDDDNDAADDDNDEEVAPVKAAPTVTASSSKKKGAKAKKQPSKNKKEDDEIDSLLAQIESTSVSTKKSDKKKNKQAATTVNQDEEAFKEGEGQDLEDILKEIDEKFDEKDRRKEAKKEKKKKKKDKETEAAETKPVATETSVEKSTTEKAPVATKTEVQEDETGAAAAASDEKKSSSKSKKKAAAEKKAKGGVDAKTLSLMKEFQRKQEEAKLKAMQDEEAELRLQEELEKQREERIRLEKERRDKKKQKEKDRIQRKKEEGSYLTKEQREKLERARVQLEAAGIQVPARNTEAKAANNGEQPVKKRVLYDDRRKKNQANSAKQAGTADSTATGASATATSVETEKALPTKEEDNLKDDWEQESEEEVAGEGEESQTPTTETARINLQQVTPAPSMTTTTTSAKNAGNESSEDESSDDESSSNESEETSSSSDDDETSQLSPFERVKRRLQRRHETCESRRSTEVLRAPVICVLGHVDTGKTKILDNLRRTHVQDGEAGGITQQIGATNVPLETIRERTKMCRKLVSREGDYIIPGLLIIDTPGHESFKNLRSRGSSLCDLAILVVDLMHGIEPQTLESIQLLIERKTPFIVALNKIDRLYNWKGDNKRNVELVLEEQSPNTRNEFEKRCNDVIVQFAEQGLNVALYYKNPDPNEFYSMVPTSAHTGDGMGSLIAMIIERCQTTLAKRLSYTDELQATVMEVKAIGGLGTTIDVVLVNGHLHVGDTIIVAGQEGPIVTQVRGLLMPEPNRELRVRNQYQNYKSVKAARGIKIAAKDLEKSMAGLPLFVGRKDDEVDYFRNEIQNILKTALSSIKLKENGVYVQASTLGSLEALLEFLKTSNIPYAGINIGPVHRKDIIRASTQLERDAQWAVVLAFDVRIEKDAQDHADSVGVKIFQADIIYHLFDMFIAHRERVKKENQEKFRHLAVFPCKLKVLPQFIFNSRDPIICGVVVEDGFIKLGTPICVPSKDFIDLGRIVSIELNHKPMEIARKGAEVCIKIDPVSGEAPKMFGRHFDESDILMSKVSRETIDVVKDHFRDEMQKSDWQLMVDLKKIFNIL